MSKKFFSLYELVLIITVIFFAFCFTTMTVKAVAERANDMRCRENLGKIAKATINYAEDYSGYSPNVNGVSWVSSSVLLQYAQSQNDWRDLLCPDSKESAKIQSGAYGQAKNTLRMAIKASYGFMALLNQNWMRERSKLHIKLSTAPSPSKNGLMADISETGKDPFIIINSGLPQETKASQYHGMGWRHGEKCDMANVAFFDGHVEAISRDSATERFNAKPLEIILPL